MASTATAVGALQSVPQRRAAVLAHLERLACGGMLTACWSVTTVWSVTAAVRSMRWSDEWISPPSCV